MIIVVHVLDLAFDYKIFGSFLHVWCFLIYGRFSISPPSILQDFTVKKLADIVGQICQGMRALAKRKIVYRMLSTHTCM